MLTTTGRTCLVLSLAATAVTGPRAPQTVLSLGAADPATVLGAVLELGLLAAAAWFLAAVSLTAAPGDVGRRGRALVPAAVRTTVFVGVVGAGFGGVAHAESADWPVEGLRLPERALVAPSAVPGTVPDAGSDARAGTEPEAGPQAVPAPPSPSTGPPTRPLPTGSPGRAAPSAPEEPDVARRPTEAAPSPTNGRGPTSGSTSGSTSDATSDGASTGPSTQHVVVPGDTLWALAASTLHPSASPQEVQRRVTAVHRSNRDVIGADPDLIRPGQRIDLLATDGGPR